MPILVDDICLNKSAIIERSLRRMKEEFSADPELENWTHVDAMTLNIERACQAAIDLAMHIVGRDHLGMPQSSSDSFRLLERSKIISKETTKAMVAMVGFRNVAIHEYQSMNLAILKEIAANKWRSMVDFCVDLGLTLRVEIEGMGE